MTTPTVAEVVAALRSYADDPYSGGSYTDELRARQAADLLEREHRARTEAERERDGMMTRWHMACDDYGQMKERAETAERELAALRNRPCPYVHSSREGTHYCTLPHVAEKELAELRKRVAEAPRGMVRGFMLEPETQPGWLDKMGGKRVAIVPLREGE